MYVNVDIMYNNAHSIIYYLTASIYAVIPKSCYRAINLFTCVLMFLLISKNI